MQADDLALFVALDALLQEVSVTKAAQRLGLSTPAMSHALARIRERFGDPLLVRSGRGMVLTPRAEQLRPRVRDIIVAATQALAVDRPFEPRSLEREFVIRATDYVLTVLGTALDHEVRSSAPKVALRFVPNGHDDAEALREGEADIAIGIYGELPPELRTRQLLTDRFVCVVAANHPKIRKRLSLDQYVRAEHIQIAPRGRPGGYVDEALAELGHARSVARAVPYFLAAMQLAAVTDYVLTVSERIALALAPVYGLRILEPPLELEAYALRLLWHPRFDGDGPHRWLREALVTAAAVVAGDVHANPRTRLGKR